MLLISFSQNKYLERFDQVLFSHCLKFWAGDWGEEAKFDPIAHLRHLTAVLRQGQLKLHDF